MAGLVKDAQNNSFTRLHSNPTQILQYSLPSAFPRPLLFSVSSPSVVTSLHSSSTPCIVPSSLQPAVVLAAQHPVQLGAQHDSGHAIWRPDSHRLARKLPIHPLIILIGAHNSLLLPRAPRPTSSTRSQTYTTTTSPGPPSPLSTSSAAHSSSPPRSSHSSQARPSSRSRAHTSTSSTAPSDPRPTQMVSSADTEIGRAHV